MQKQKQQKPKSKFFRRMILNILLFVILIFGTFFFVFKDQDLGEIISLILGTNLAFVLLGILLMLVYFALESWNIKSVLNSLGEDVSFFRAFKFTMIGFFFCSITPGASGGQPLEIYYMGKDGVSTANATVAVLIHVFGVQVAVVGFGLISGLLNPSFLEGPLLVLFIAGVIINGLALLGLFFFIVSPNVLGGLLYGVNGFLSLFMSKEKIENLNKRTAKAIKKYSNSSIYIKTHRSVFFKAVFKSVLQMAAYFMIPFCVYLAFGLSGTSIVTIFMIQAILFISTSGLPLPGAIGASESVFLGLYAKIFGENILSSAMLVNRGINFYGFVIISMIFVIINLMVVSKHKK